MIVLWRNVHWFSFHVQYSAMLFLWMKISFGTCRDSLYYWFTVLTLKIIILSMNIFPVLLYSKVQYTRHWNWEKKTCCIIPLWNIQKQQCILYAKFPQACQATCHRIAVCAWQKAHFSSDAQMFVCTHTHTHTHTHADITCLLRMSGNDWHYELLGYLCIFVSMKKQEFKGFRTHSVMQWALNLFYFLAICKCK